MSLANQQERKILDFAIVQVQQREDVPLLSSNTSSIPQLVAW